MITAAADLVFWDRVEKTETCWLWTGRKYHGYGRLWDGEHEVRAHRFAYELLVGPIPEGMQLDHLCRVRHCVNPEHLEPVTHTENVLRGVAPSAANARKTHCQHGHPFDEANTYHHRGQRTCRTCERARYRDRRRRAGYSEPETPPMK